MKRCSILVTVIATWAIAQTTIPYERVSEETFRARLPFFEHDASIPLEARVVREWDEDKTLRQKFVFRGAQGFLVPGYLEFPKAGTEPHPLVLLLHGWSGSKEDWYNDDNFVYGGILRKAVLDAGFAVLALDAATHGERSNEIDYQHVNPFDDSAAPARKNYFTYAEISIQTVKDYRRALDYVATRGDVNMERIGLVGYSMGGMDAMYLLSVEPRIRAAVACVPPFTNSSYGPANPVDFTWGVGDTPFLLLMGMQDDMYEKERVDASYAAYIKRPTTDLIWYDRGHKLGSEYVQDALAWIEKHG